MNMNEYDDGAQYESETMHDLQKRIEELETALKPFANAYTEYLVHLKDITSRNLVIPGELLSELDFERAAQLMPDDPGIAWDGEIPF